MSQTVLDMEVFQTNWQYYISITNLMHWLLFIL